MTTLPDKAYLSQSRQPQLYGAYGSTYALAVIAVGLRLSARKYFSKAGFWWDDYAICAALACATGNFVDMIICKQNHNASNSRRLTSWPRGSSWSR